MLAPETFQTFIYGVYYTDLVSGVKSAMGKGDHPPRQTCIHFYRGKLNPFFYSTSREDGL